MATQGKTPETPLYEEKDIIDPTVLPVSESTDKGLVDSDVAAARQMFTYEDGERLKRKADWRLLSLLALCYLLKNMDQQLAPVSAIPVLGHTSFGQQLTGSTSSRSTRISQQTY